ncbi:MAG: aminoacyl-histidine dipeptidase [Bacteroidales bacterium]|nr:aminoacyl-histidine dipeptidase [Bacteroidales bacterium]
MDKNISALEPQNVWANFYALTQQPRPSKHEEKVRAFLVDFARQRGIEVQTDKTGNVIMRKGATPGMENRKGVILQAHMDMVPQKNADKQHDFLTDPIEAYIDGEWVTANGTTLGADNGMGVAAALAVLESQSLKHGPVEVLITTDEETGMTGAFGLESGLLKGDILLNLDSETEGELYVGCAGGLDATIDVELDKEAVDASMAAYKLSLTGLKGGHSGMDIVLGRGNANKLMNRLLVALREADVRLASLDGGSLRNAIPRESFATIVLPKQKESELKPIVDAFFADTKAELSAVEPDYSLSCQPAELPAQALTARATACLCNLVYGIPNGVVRMSDSMPGLVETSTNMAIVKVEDQGQKCHATISCLLRSSVDTAKYDLARNMQAVVDLTPGAKAEFTGAYPGWKPNMDSPILKEMREVYRKMYGKEPKIMAIHAGLECGLFGGVYKHWDMISFGPTIVHPHSPDEKVNIASVKKFWDYLVATLENIPSK